MSGVGIWRENVYLTRIEIDPYSREAAGLLGNAYTMHQALCDLTDASRSESKMLHRIVRMPDRTSVYVYTEDPIEPSSTRRGFRVGAARDMQPMLDKLRPGQMLAFDLVAVPCKKAKPDDPAVKNSRRVVLREPEERMNWLRRQLERNGFELVAALEKAPVDMSARKRGTKAGFRLRGYHYAGRVRVVDPRLAQRALAEGIGSERAFGYGMLLVRPV